MTRRLRNSSNARMLAHRARSDCKKGFHIYCLTPPLADVPDDDWLCPKCTKKQ